ncbi:hypothetical protein Acr_25g0007020 [Actinidia rufa]|uniref:Uncharacterized protein n=1 Tax=Actinidia rufa TaxID=165716 RepID=A0A7J0GZP1_9ERIC|nr:hypothetical protein Acr_25g0007020 [Actinidia rufa]
MTERRAHSCGFWRSYLYEAKACSGEGAPSMEGSLWSGLNKGSVKGLSLVEGGGGLTMERVHSVDRFHFMEGSTKNLESGSSQLIGAQQTWYTTEPVCQAAKVFQIQFSRIQCFGRIGILVH